MKRLIIATTMALGFAAVGLAQAAQDAEQSDSMQSTVNVTATPGQEAYTIDFPAGYGLKVLVGHTHQRYMQARRTAWEAESLRKQGQATSPYVTVAVENASGPGIARQIRVFDADEQALAIVNVYCKHRVNDEGNYCLLDTHATGAGMADENLARVPTATERQRLAQLAVVH